MRQSTVSVVFFLPALTVWVPSHMGPTDESEDAGWDEWPEDLCGDDDLSLFQNDEIWLPEGDEYSFERWFIPPVLGGRKRGQGTRKAWLCGCVSHDFAYGSVSAHSITSTVPVTKSGTVSVARPMRLPCLTAYPFVFRLANASDAGAVSPQARRPPRARFPGPQLSGPLSAR